MQHSGLSPPALPKRIGFARPARAFFDYCAAEAMYMAKKPKESLVNWVIRITPPKPTPSAKPNTPEQPALPATVACPRHVLIAEWA